MNCLECLGERVSFHRSTNAVINERMPTVTPILSHLSKPTSKIESVGSSPNSCASGFRGCHLHMTQFEPYVSKVSKFMFAQKMAEDAHFENVKAMQ
jgi:hypothetical protein